MRFRNKQKAEKITPSEQYSEDDSGIDAFIDRHSGQLVSSANHWQNVGSTMKAIKTDSNIVNAMNIGVARAFEGADVPANQVQVEREAQRILNQLSIYMQVVARSEAKDTKGISKSIKSGLMVLQGLPAPNVVAIFKSKEFPRFKFPDTYLRLIEHISKADNISDQVLGDMCDQYAVTPDSIVELASMYEAGADEAFPVLGELRNMITADWHRLDPETSVLRQHCKRLAEDPGIHVAPFCEAASRLDSLQSVAQMARYAIVSAGGNDLSDEAVAGQLASTSSRWNEVPDLQEAFNDYVEQVGTTIEGAFSSIAGPRHIKNIRIEHTSSEIMECASDMEVWGSANGYEARLNAKARSTNARRSRKAKLSNHTLPTADDSIRQLDATELLKERGVKVARFANGRGYELDDVEELTPEYLVERFKLEPDHVGIGDDMMSVVDYLRQPEHSYRGVRRLESTDMKLNGKRHTLWRFAPDKTPGLKVRSTNRFYRVIYTVVDGNLVLYDMLSHAEFDKKYRV